MLRKLIFLLFCTFYLTVSGFAQLSDAGRWAVEANLKYGFIEPNITYGKADGVELKLDVYRPKTQNSKPLPTLLYIHGGAWFRGSKESYSLRLLPWLEKGWNVVNVEYRLTGAAKAPAAAEDCRCALRWVMENAEKYNFDKNKIVVGGQSVGGHLALLTGMATNEKAFDKNCAGAETRVAAIFSWSGFIDIGDLLQGPQKFEYAVNWIGADRLEQTDLIKRVSPISYAREVLPPIILVHGDADTTHPYSQAVRLHEALNKAKVPNQLFTVPKGGNSDFPLKDTIASYEAIFAFLKKRGIE